jgi:IclR family KDG regulon transcriptional repressor
VNSSTANARTNGRIVPAVRRAFDILELFLTHDGPLSAPEIAKLTALPRTTVHELIHTLVEGSYLVAEDANTRRFKLGPALLSLGYRYQTDLDIAREGQLVAQRISGICGETVHVATLEGDHVLYVAKVDSTRSVRMVSRVGGRLPAHVTGVGKVLLAGLPEAQLARVLSEHESLAALTPNSITDPDKLRRELQRVREDGVAFEFRESNDHVGCVAAPVRDHSGRVVAGLSISQLMTSFDKNQMREHASLVREGAAELSNRLGWSEPIEQ